MNIKDVSPIVSVDGVPVNLNYIQSKNCTSLNSRDVVYIVIHYTGNPSDTALANARYFYNNTLKSSAHYFVDEGNIYQSVALKDRAWHCGANRYFHDNCRNSNSIGVEMCTSNNYTASPMTIERTAHLTAALAKYIGIPVNEVSRRVLRHYDVTYKHCPAQWIYGDGFERFKNRVVEIMSESESHNTYNNFLNKLAAKGIISDKALWSKYSESVTKAQVVALIDKATGGTWTSDEANPNIHWAHPMVISLCGKGIISDKTQWENSLDFYVPVSLFLALIDKATGGMKSKYLGRAIDHWGRNHLDSLCDKGIVTTPQAWTNFDGQVSRGNAMALICKAFNI